MDRRRVSAVNPGVSASGAYAGARPRSSSCAAPDGVGAAPLAATPKAGDGAGSGLKVRQTKASLLKRSSIGAVATTAFAQAGRAAGRAPGVGVSPAAPKAAATTRQPGAAPPPAGAAPSSSTLAHAGGGAGSHPAPLPMSDLQSVIQRIEALKARNDEAAAQLLIASDAIDRRDAELAVLRTDLEERDRQLDERDRQLQALTREREEQLGERDRQLQALTRERDVHEASLASALGSAARRAEEMAEQQAHYEALLADLRSGTSSAAAEAQRQDNERSVQLRQLLATRERSFLNRERERGALMLELRAECADSRARADTLAVEVGRLRSRLSQLHGHAGAEMRALVAAIAECEAETAALYEKPLIPPPGRRSRGWQGRTSATASLSPPSGGIERAAVDTLHRALHLHAQQAVLEYEAAGSPPGALRSAASPPGACFLGLGDGSPTRGGSGGGRTTGSGAPLGSPAAIAQSVLEVLTRALSPPSGAERSALTPRSGAERTLLATALGPAAALGARQRQQQQQQQHEQEHAGRPQRRSDSALTEPAAGEAAGALLSPAHDSRALSLSPPGGSGEMLADGAHVVMEGWCLKRSRWIKSWRHRWLVLTSDRRLLTFKQPPSARRGRAPDVADATEVIQLDVSVSIGDADLVQGDTHGAPLASELISRAAFSLKPEGSDGVLFAALSMKARDEWIEAIHAARNASAWAAPTRRALDGGGVPAQHAAERLATGSLFGDERPLVRAGEADGSAHVPPSIAAMLERGGGEAGADEEGSDGARSGTATPDPSRRTPLHASHRVSGGAAARGGAEEAPSRERGPHASPARPSPLMPTSEAHVRRQAALEIVYTERKYVHQLRLMANVYRPALVASLAALSGRSPSLARVDRADTVFAGLDALLGLHAVLLGVMEEVVAPLPEPLDDECGWEFTLLHRTFVADVEREVDAPDAPEGAEGAPAHDEGADSRQSSPAAAVGRGAGAGAGAGLPAPTAVESLLPVYASWVGHYSSAADALATCVQKPAVAHALRAVADAQPRAHGSLQLLLAAPLQRLPRYRTLLRAVLGATPSAHTGQHDARAALARVEWLIEHVNASCVDEATMLAVGSVGDGADVPSGASPNGVAPLELRASAGVGDEGAAAPWRLSSEPAWAVGSHDAGASAPELPTPTPVATRATATSAVPGASAATAMGMGCDTASATAAKRQTTSKADWPRARGGHASASDDARGDERMI